MLGIPAGSMCGWQCLVGTSLSELLLSCIRRPLCINAQVGLAWAAPQLLALHVVAICMSMHQRGYLMARAFSVSAVLRQIAATARILLAWCSGCPHVCFRAGSVPQRLCLKLLTAVRNKPDACLLSVWGVLSLQPDFLQCKAGLVL